MAFTPVKVQGFSSAVAVSSGYSYTCAVSTSGEVYCWGSGGFGQLGNGQTSDKSSPVKVQGLSSIADVSAGDSHTCAVSTSGEIYCWGYGEDGQLGNGQTSNSATPVKVQGLSSAIAVSAGGIHTCAVSTSEDVYCWGAGGLGQLGNGQQTSSIATTPVKVQGLSSIADVSAGDDQTCAVSTSGDVYCWGAGGLGQLGHGQTSTNSATPVKVQSLSSGAAVSAGGLHACAVSTGRDVYCWGYGESGQLGNGKSGDGYQESTPVEVQFN